MRNGAASKPPTSHEPSDERSALLAEIAQLREQVEGERTALRESEARFRATFETAAVGIAHVGLGGEWLRVNAALCDLLGYDEEELRTKTFGDVTHPDDFDADWALVRRLVMGEIPNYNLDKRYIRKDGAVVWASLTVALARDEGGRPTYFVSVVRDVAESRAAQADAEAERRLLSAVLEALPVGVLISDPNGRIVRDNAANRELWGIPPDTENWEAYGEWEGYWPDTGERIQAHEWAMARALLHGETTRGELVRNHRFGTGERRYYLNNAAPVRDADGKIVGGVVAEMDVTEERARVVALEITATIGEALARELDVRVLAEALCDSATKAIGARFGAFFYNSTDATGAFGLYVLSGAERSAFENFSAVRSTPLFEPTFSGRESVLSKDVPNDPRFGGMPDSHVPIRSYLAVPVRSRSGDVIGALLFGHPEPGKFDEEHLRLVEVFSAQAAMAYENALLVERLKEANESLERRVATRTAALQASNEALEGFTYHVAHDLRAPLRSILLTCRLIEEEFGEAAPRAALELLERQEKAAKRLASLIDDLLEMARLSRKEAKRSPTDLTAMAQGVAEEALAAHPGTQVDVVVEEGLGADADPRLLRLALGNLVENAVKYSPAGGTIRVGRREDGAFYVSDEGIGIDPEYFEKVFEPFERLHGATAFGGTGIGLSNARQIVRLHQGRIWVEATPGQGSTFFFTLGDA